MGPPDAVDGADDLVRVLSPDGKVVDRTWLPDLEDDTLVDMYREMRLARRFDERAVSLQRQGRLGTYPPLAGQEGSQVGSAHALAAEDWVVYQYREHAVPLVRGVDPAHLLRYWMGYESGDGALADANVFPVNISIGSHLPHATGMAWAAKLRGDDSAVVCHFGDGATSEGDFHEALNFAGVFDVPCAFVCNNNGYAISVPTGRQTASDTLAGKAAAYGFEGVRVDGMDPLASYAVADAAMRKARDPEGERPTLIEMVQYRFGAHTTADDPSAYRDEAEVEEWRRLDPVPRFEAFLRDRGLLDDERVDAIGAAVEDTVGDAVEAAEDAHDGRDPAGMFDHVYGDLPEGLRRQREHLLELRARHGDRALLKEDLYEG